MSAEADWTDAIDMDGAQVAVADYCPDWWPATTRLLIRRVRLDIADRTGQRRPAVAAAPHPAPRPAGPADGELADADAVYGYSFIVTNLDVSTRDGRARSSTGTGTAPRWRTCSGTPSTAPRCGTCPPGHPEVNRAWMWGALLAVSLTGWLHQLTATPTADGHCSVTASATARP